MKNFLVILTLAVAVTGCTRNGLGTYNIGPGGASGKIIIYHTDGTIEERIEK